MAKRNNVNVDSLMKTVRMVQEDVSKGRRTNRVEGVWNLGEGPQFSAEIGYEGGKLVLEADQPTYMGGEGARPNPMLYCLFGLASCYASTFACVAAAEGVRLKSLRVAAESAVNHSRSLGLSDAPNVEKIRLVLSVEADADRAKVEELEALARQRCPAVYCIANAIPLTTSLHVE